MAVNLAPLVMFSAVGGGTPGPNNLMLAASGVNFGMRRTMPHLMGVWLGFLLMLTLVCAGLGKIFQTLPELQLLLKVAGSGYLLYLAWRIASAAPARKADVGKPIRFLEAVLFQYVNPKAWMMAVTLSSAYTVEPRHLLADTLLIVGTHAAVSLPTTAMWAWFGVALRRFLNAPKRLRVFNLTMAALLVASLAFILSPTA